ncbi:imidazole glycerol phosphate synthase subunit HisH [Limnobacter sp.]|uniref:imidazole glycerol phosphate synthase subunit HisH n=1 Tax=Limnobacter sp. TaxID=2003368 RepID=UPI00311F38C3
MITILDYGVGNLASILNMFRKIGATAQISSDPEKIKQSSKLLLPGVGSFDHGMQMLQESGLKTILDDCVLNEKKPILGICLGMQLMTKGSEEGILPGLGWVDAEVKRFNFPDSRIKIPHMGWNEVSLIRPDFLTSNLGEQSRFYFVHSYHVVTNVPNDIILQTSYGITFTSGFRNSNIYGVQFHPEKSHKFGMNLLKNFAAIQS